ncbi:MAG: hypothetical protein LBK26_02360 [Rickettsiales bacterium]|jgi:hypothetical protein|nr:hypothetical protein [Rickettsiales bacterium]
MIRNQRFLGSGHESDAYMIDHDVYGENIVMKCFGGWNDGPTIWHNKQVFAKEKVSDIINALPGRTYKIPKVFEIDKLNKYETLAPGAPLTRELFDSLSKQDQQDVLFAHAEFLHDIHHEIQEVSLEQYLSGRLNACAPVSFDDALVMMKENLQITKSFEVFLECRAALSSYESAKTPAFVMSCNDYLKPENVLYDLNSKTLSFFDLAQCVYSTIDNDMYKYKQQETSDRQIFNGAECAQLLEIYNSMPQKNSGLGEPEDIRAHFDELSYVYEAFLRIIADEGSHLPGRVDPIDFYQSHFAISKSRIIKMRLNEKTY